MGWCCCVPGCRIGYSSTPKPKKVLLHEFPKEAILRSKWIKAINGDNWVPTKNCRVCSLHFHTHNYGIKSKDRRQRSYTGGRLERRLKLDAYPTRFDKLSNLLEKSISKPRPPAIKIAADARRERENAIIVAEQQIVLQNDRIVDFEDLKAKFDELVLTHDIIHVWKSDFALFYHISLTPSPHIAFSITLRNDMTVKVHILGNEIPLKYVGGNNSTIVITSKKQFLEIISATRNQFEKIASPTGNNLLDFTADLLENSLDVLKTELEPKITFLVEQIRLCKGTKNRIDFPSHFWEWPYCGKTAVQICISKF